MVRREPDRRPVRAQVGQPQRPRVHDQLTEQALALRQRAHRGPGLLVDAHVHEPRDPPVRGEHAQRPVPGVDQVHRGLHDAAQRRLQLQAGGHGQHRVQQPLHPVPGGHDLRQPLLDLGQQLVEPQPRQHPRQRGRPVVIAGHRHTPRDGNPRLGLRSARSGRSRADAESIGTFGRRERHSGARHRVAQREPAIRTTQWDGATWTQHRSALGLPAEQVSAAAHRGGPGPLAAQQPALAVPAAPALDRAARRPRPAAAGRRPGRAGAAPGLRRRPVQPAAGPARAGDPPDRHDLPRPRAAGAARGRPATADTNRPRRSQLRLCEAIPTRRTNRRPFADVPVARPSSTHCGRPPSRRAPGCS